MFWKRGLQKLGEFVMVLGDFSGGGESFRVRGGPMVA